MGIYDVSIAINYCYNYWLELRLNEYETHAIVYLPMVQLRSFTYQLSINAQVEV